MNRVLSYAPNCQCCWLKFCVFWMHLCGFSCYRSLYMVIRGRGILHNNNWQIKNLGFRFEYTRIILCCSIKYVNYDSHYVCNCGIKINAEICNSQSAKPAIIFQQALAGSARVMVLDKVSTSMTSMMCLGDCYHGYLDWYFSTYVLCEIRK